MQKKECPPTWDGWQCWDSTKAGITAMSYCPRYVYFITEPPTCSIPLVKECSSNGTWAHRNGREWTNYAVCVKSTVTLQQNRSYVLVAAYGISIIALIPAMIIFFSYKQLRVHRIILHQNFFFSLILNALLVIIFKTLVMMSESNETTSTVSNSVNSIACRLLLISTKYSRMTNYMWMLSEGFYLHKLIAAAFAEQKSLLVFYLIGWVFPLFPVAFYAGFRILAANDKCWVVPKDEWEWALNGPSLLSLLVNALFLINIIRVLVTKLRAAHAQEPSQYRKAVRATLVLLPLFGLHFIVTIYRPSSSKGVCQNWTELYFYANDVLDGMQGFLVALIFCYCNGEVLSLLKRTYTRWKEQHFDVNPRRNSRHRPSRGSVMGRSVVSTHIYSSIPPSPETNVIALPSGSNPSSKDPSPSSQLVGTSLLTVNGSSGPITITSNVSPDVKKSDSKSSLKNRKNHTSNTTNGNAIKMYVSSEYGNVKENPGVEISCV
ncbi:Calcitonin-like peptide type 1 receptor [Orchesella cincta]|uniref:Calcitonin-like peptide type 1 receptor n=1 Tax=Orchesella cincta TaxID=48709 RepID=A0A1D2MYP8_ORCCI|nr:Calcitonin-like peptide type 1 receptor [Orchesella cincta]